MQVYIKRKMEECLETGLPKKQVNAKPAAFASSTEAKNNTGAHHDSPVAPTMEYNDQNIRVSPKRNNTMVLV